MIKFDKVTKKFGQTIALENVSFEIKKGEFVFLVGPSGVGKTTILRLLLKEIELSSGKIIFDGQNLKTVSSKEIPLLRRKLGAVFQDYKLLFDRTIFENIALSLEIRGLTEKEIKAKVKRVLILVGLKGKDDFFPTQLSGGELQRVVIARAVVSEPLVVFADEPTGNLDEGTSWQIIKLLKKINDRGTTLIMATHNTEIVDSFSQRTIRLEKGKVINDQAKSVK